MTSNGDGGGGDGDCVLLRCTDPNECDLEADNPGILISTSEISSWDLSKILNHQIVTVKASKNRLIEQSSYFRGLLCGSFSESNLSCMSIRWNLQTLMNILEFMFGYSVDITSNNFLALFEGALFFGVEMLLSKCKAWFINETMPKGLLLMQIQLDDLIHIWRFGVEHGMRAICSESFPSVPSNLLISCIKHPDLTVESEWHLADAVIVWLAANAKQFESWDSTNGDYSLYLKEIRIGLLPLWFVAGKRRCCFFSKFAQESIGAILNLIAHSSQSISNDLSDYEAYDLKIRLSQYTKKVDISGFPHSNIPLVSLLPRPCSAEIMLTTSTKLRYKYCDRDQYLQALSFETVEEVDISNCPSLHLEAAINCFCKSFPSLRVLKATHYLNFDLTNLGQLLQKFPLLTEVDLTVDIHPIVLSEASIVSSSLAVASRVSTVSPRTTSSGSANLYMSRPLLSNLTRLTLEGRVDVTDQHLMNISLLCASLCYVNLRGCTSVTDGGISAFILRCSKLHSVIVCGTSFGRTSILALMSGISDLNSCSKSEIKKDYCKSMAFKFQELQMGGCKGIDSTSLSKLMSRTPMLKILCLRELQYVDEALFSFIGSSLEMLDVSDTKVCGAALAQIVCRNPRLKCLRAKGCPKLYHQDNTTERNWYMELVNAYRLVEISLGWGLSSFSLEALKPAIATLKKITVGIGATLGHDALELLPTMCPLLESVSLYFQVISDSVVINLMGSLEHLQVLVLGHCLGEISPLSFRSSMKNLRKLQLDRVTPWMTNDDLVTLTQNCANLVELYLLGCRLLNSDSQHIISSGWPGLISIHLEDCGEVTVEGVSSLFDCIAVENLLLRHNGPGIQRNFILHATAVMPMLRKVSVDVCDSVEGDFDIPNFGDRWHLSIVKIARCKPQRCVLESRKGCRRPVHKETLVMVWDSKSLNRMVVKERL